MDRSPVHLERCEWRDGRTSVFPDVLLTPGEEISVVCPAYC